MRNSVIFAFLLVGGCATGPRTDLLTQRIKEQTAIGSRAFQQGNFEIVADQTYPGLIALFGGHRRAVAAMKAGMNETRAKGLRVVAFDFGEPSRPISSNGKLISVVPTTTTMALAKPKARITQKSFMLAISVDNGATWTFIEGSKLTPEFLAKLIPDLPSNFRLPKTEPPVVERVG